MYFDLTYYYHTKLTFFSSCAQEKAEIDRAVFLGLQIFLILTQLPIHYYKSFRQLLLNQVHHHNIRCNTALFHAHIH